jgi:hypothetical protein
VFYTYLHRRTDDGLAFYIGKGRGERAKSRHGRNKHWTRVADKHGYTVEILAEWPTEAEAFEHEKFLIACFRDLGYPLVNQTDGGEGPTGLRHTAETKARIAALKTGRAHSAETRAKMSQAHRGKPKSPEHKANISRAKRGVKMSADRVARMSASRKGIPLSAEHRNKVVAATKERMSSDAGREWASATFKGKPKSAEHKAKIGAAQKAYRDRVRAEKSQQPIGI